MSTNTQNWRKTLGQNCSPAGTSLQLHMQHLPAGMPSQLDDLKDLEVVAPTNPPSTNPAKNEP